MNNNIKSPTNSSNLKGGMLKDLRVSVEVNSNRGNSPKTGKGQSPSKMLDVLKAKVKIESPKSRSPGTGSNQGSFNFNSISVSKTNNKDLRLNEKQGSPDRAKQAKAGEKKVDLNNFNSNLNNIFSALKNSSLMTPSTGVGGSTNISRKPTEVVTNRSRSKEKESKKSNSPLKFNNLFANVNTNISSNNNRNIKKKEDENINVNVNSGGSNTSSPVITNNIQPITKQQINLENTLTCFKEYFYREDKNLKYRNAMEDFGKVVEKYMGDPNKAFFSLYDGHGGSDPVIYVKDRMPDLLQKCLQIKENTIETSLTQAFNKIDDELKFCDSENTGCTACVIYITIDAGKRILYSANVGDSRCVLVSTEEAIPITQDHKCSDTAEVERVRESGGIVFSGRVFGQLVLTRALGDHALKSYGVISTPYISKYEIEDKHRYIVMASDGVWDVMSCPDVFKVSQSVYSAEEFSRILVKTAIDGGSKDNISCIVIKLN